MVASPPGGHGHGGIDPLAEDGPRHDLSESTGLILRRFAIVLPWALLMLFTLRGWQAMGADGTTVDEPLHLAYGERALATGTFRRENDGLNSKMPVSVLNALPLALARRGREMTWPQQLFLARLPSLFLGALLGFLVWRWAHALFGAWGGNLALLLYTFCPNVLAHSHLVTTDISTSLAMFAATYCLWRYLTAPSHGRLLLLAAVFGAAQLTKVTALFLVPIFVLILGVRAVRGAVREWPFPAHRRAWQGAFRFLAREAAKGALLLLVLGIGAVAALNIGFLFERTGTPLARYSLISPVFQSLARTPLLSEVPLPVPYAYIQGLDMVSRDTRAGFWSYLRGRYSATGFRSYFFWAFLVKVPIATQILLAVAVWLWGAGRARAPGADEFLLAPVIVLGVCLSLFFELDIGFRYILPIFPFGFVFIARAASPQVVATLRRPLWKPIAAAALLVWLAVSSLAFHPHYIPYFNEWAGGPMNGSRWLIDSNLDWGQEGDYLRRVYAPRSPVFVLFDPTGPVAGRIALGITSLVGRDPGSARRHAWLRDNFKPIATIGYSWEVFDVSEAELRRCCAGMPRARIVEDPAADLAMRGEPFGGGDGVMTRFEDRLNDGMLGDNEPVDPARTLPPQDKPVRAWFGIDWAEPQTLGRVVAYPSYLSRGEMARKFLALDYVFQSWDGVAWRDIPGTRVAGNQSLRVEHRFAPLSTRRIRLLIERERNERGTEEPAGAFRAACLELAAYRQ
jgi:hypothetical protein